MTIHNKILGTLLVAGSIALAAPAMAHGMDGMRGGHCGQHHPGGAMMHDEMGPFGGGMHLPPFMRELNLSDAQHDKIFKIMHDRAPALRDKAKEVSKANYELHALMFSDKYDEARVRTLSETNAQAMATLAQMRAASLNQIYQTLTPEQRKKAGMSSKTALTGRHPARAPRRRHERPGPRRL